MQLQNINKILIQGITTLTGAYYASLYKKYGTPIIAGVSAGHGGETLSDIPVYDLVEQVVHIYGNIDASLIFLPPDEVLDASLEAMACGIKRLILVSWGIPPLDMLQLLRIGKETGTLIIGSGSQGILIPEKLWLGTHEHKYYSPGSVGIVSRLDRLSDEIAKLLTQANIGQSLSVCLGKDRILGSSFEQWLEILEQDEQTKIILILGRAYGLEEIRAAQYIKVGVQKPVIFYLAGSQAPSENSWSQLSSSLSDSSSFFSTQSSWFLSLQQSEIPIVQHIEQIPSTISGILQNL